MSPPPAALWKPPQGRAPRILLVRLSALGDVIHALPVLSGLKALMPAARVTWVVEDKHAGLLEGHPDLERVVVLPRKALTALLRGWPHPLRLARGVGRFVRSLRQGDYDLALDLQGNLKSGMVAWLSGARHLVGPDREEGRGINHMLLDRRVRRPASAHHKVERNLALLSAVLGEVVPYVPPRLALTVADHASARKALEAARLPTSGFVVLHPGTSGFGRFKRWPTDRYGALARRLSDPQHPAAITFGPDERALADDVASASDGCAVPVPTGSLRTLAAVLASARLVVAGDTGPLHLAALLGTRVLGIYGPKDPRVYGPYGVRADGTAALAPPVVQKDVACRPCELRRCDAPLCLTTLAPEVVYDAALRA